MPRLVEGLLVSDFSKSIGYDMEPHVCLLCIGFAGWFSGFREKLLWGAHPRGSRRPGRKPIGLEERDSLELCARMVPRNRLEFRAVVVLGAVWPHFPFGAPKGCPQERLVPIERYAYGLVTAPCALFPLGRFILHNAGRAPGASTDDYNYIAFCPQGIIPLVASPQAGHRHRHRALRRPPVVHRPVWRRLS